MLSLQRRRRIRRRVSLGPLGWTAVLAPVAFLAVMVGPTLLGRELFAAGDLLEIRAPWAESSQVSTVFNWCVSDTIDSALPAQLVIRDRMASGDLMPLWEPLASGGANLTASAASGTSTPLFLLTLLVPAQMSTGLLKLLEAAVVIGGMIAWGRRLGLSVAAGAIGGMAFLSGSFMVMWTNWPQTRTAAILPLLFWSVERVIQVRTVRSALPLPIAVAMLLLGGFPSVAVHGIYAAAAYAAVRLTVEARVRRRNGAPAGWLRPTVIGIAAAVAGVLLVASRLAPMAQRLAAADLSYRADHWRTVFDPRHLLTVVFPRALGTCESDGPGWWGSVISIEAVSFVGVTVLLLCGAALAVRRTSGLPGGVRGFAVVVAVLGFAATFVGGPVNYLLHLLPLMDNSGLHRMRGIAGVMLALLAAIGFEALLRRTGQQASRRRVTAETVTALSLIGVVGVCAFVAQKLAPSYDAWAEIQPSILVGLVTACVVGVLWLAQTVRPVWRHARLALVVVPIAVLVEALLFVSVVWPRVSPELLYRDVPLNDYLAENLDGQRFIAAEAAYWAGVGKVYGLRSLSGHTFVTSEWQDLLETIDPDMFDSPTVHTLSSLDRADHPLLDRLAVKYVVVDTPTTPRGEIRMLGEVLGSSTAWLAGHEVTFEVEPSRLRGVTLDLRERSGVDDGSGEQRIVVEVRDRDGSLLASGGRRVRVDDQGWVTYPIAAESAADAQGPIEVTVRLEGPGDVEVGADAEAVAVLGIVVADPADPTVLIGTDDAQGYERPTAAPRIRWAGDAVGYRTTAEALTLMQEVPDSTVVLPLEDLAELPFDGQSATVDVQVDEGDRIEVEVDALGSGVLVVADAWHPTWRATVDGEPVEVLRVEHAVMGVAVSPGTHTVELTYVPAGWPWLVWVGLLTAAGLLGVAVVTAPGRRRSRGLETVPSPSASGVTEVRDLPG